jgi:hypothetical protein
MHVCSPWVCVASALLLGGPSCSRPAPPAHGHDAEAESSPPAESAVAKDPAGEGSAEALAPRQASRVSAPFPEARVKLLDAGDSPRHQLRYAWTAGKREQLSLDMRTSLLGDRAEGQLPEVPLPSVRVLVTVASTSVSEDGTLTYDWRVAFARVMTDDRSAPQVADGMRAEAVAVEDLSGTGAVDSRGLAKELSVDPAESSDEVTSRPIALQVLQTLWNVAAPLPQEEVGVGARWQRVSELAAKNARATQTDSFTLASLDGSRGTLDDALTQIAPEQALSVPGMANGSRAQMGSMLASGVATTRFELSHLIPDTRFRGTTTMVLANDESRGNDPGTKMVLRVEIDLSGAPR